MSFVLAALPGSRVISVPHLSTAQKVAETEQLACTTGLTPHMTTTILQTLGHDSLAGEALMLAWLEVEQAIACRDATDPDDGDYEGYAERADDKIHDFIHGTGTARGSGNHTGEIA
jgi:hypothetical protein